MSKAPTSILRPDLLEARQSDEEDAKAAQGLTERPHGQFPEQEDVMASVRKSLGEESTYVDESIPVLDTSAIATRLEELKVKRAASKKLFKDAKFPARGNVDSQKNYLNGLSKEEQNEAVVLGMLLNDTNPSDLGDGYLKSELEATYPLIQETYSYASNEVKSRGSSGTSDNFVLERDTEEPTEEAQVNSPVLEKEDKKQVVKEEPILGPEEPPVIEVADPEPVLPFVELPKPTVERDMTFKPDEKTFGPENQREAVPLPEQPSLLSRPTTPSINPEDGEIPSADIDLATTELAPTNIPSLNKAPTSEIEPIEEHVPDTNVTFPEIEVPPVVVPELFLPAVEGPIEPVEEHVPDTNVTFPEIEVTPAVIPELSLPAVEGPIEPVEEHVPDTEVLFPEIVFSPVVIPKLSLPETEEPVEELTKETSGQLVFSPQRTAMGRSYYSNPDFMSQRDLLLKKEADKEADVGTAQKWRDVIDSEWVYPNYARSSSRSARDAGTPVITEFKLTSEEREDYMSNYNDNEMKYILEASSEQMLKYHISDIAGDRERDVKNQRAGLAMTFAANVFDPAALLLSAGTGFVGHSVKVSRAVNALRLGGVASVENALVSYAQMEGNTSRDWSDVALDASLGFALGGAIGAIQKVGTPVAVRSAIRLKKLQEASRAGADRQLYKAEKERLVTLQQDGSYRELITILQDKMSDLAYAASGSLLRASKVAGLNRILTKGRVVLTDLKKARTAAYMKIEDDFNELINTPVLTKKGERRHSNAIRQQTENRNSMLLAKQDELDAHWRNVDSRSAEDTLDTRTALNERDAEIKADEIEAKWDKAIAETEADIKARIEVLESARASTSAKVDLGTKDPEYIALRKQQAQEAIVKRYDEQIESLRSRLLGYQEKLEANEALAKRKNELLGYKSMTEEEQMAKFFPTHSKERLAEMKRVDERTIEVTKLQKKAEEDFIEKYEPEEVSTGVSNKSAGAMKADSTDLFDDQIAKADYDLIRQMVLRYVAFEDRVGKNWFQWLPDVLQSDYTRVNQSEDLGILGLNHLLADNPQFGDTLTVSTLVDMNTKALRYEGGNAIDDGFLRFLDEEGIGQLAGQQDNALRADFYKQVAFAIHEGTPASELAPSVAYARDGQVRVYDAALKLMQKYDVLGFEGIASNPRYIQDIMDPKALYKMSQEGNVGAEIIKKLIAKGYKQGDNTLSDAQARLIAHIKYESTVNNLLSSSDVRAIFNAERATDAVRIMKEAKVPQELIDDFFKDFNGIKDWDNISNRARKTLKIDWNASVIYKNTELKLSSLMNTNVAQLSEAYIKEAAYNAAMAQLGIKSEGQLRRIMDTVRRQAIDTGEDNLAQVTAHMESLEAIVNQLKGKSIVDYTGKSAKLNKSGRMLLDAVGFFRLQQLGFASFPELARVFTELGVIETIKNIPASGMFRMPNLKGKSSVRDAKMKLFKEEMREIEELNQAYIGEPELGHTFGIHEDDFGSEVSGRFAGLLENALQQGKRIGYWLNGQQFMQGGLSKMSAIGTSNRLLSAANGKELPASLRNQLKLTGMKDARWDEIKAWVQANPRTKELNGRQVPVWNIEKMPDDMYMDIRVAMNRLLDRQVLRGRTGELNTAWLGPFGRYLTQFKTFSLNSFEKQLVADMRGDSASMPMKFLFGTGLAYASYMSQTNLRALGMEESVAADYLDDHASGMKMYWGVFNKHSQMAFAGPLADAAVFTGVMPEDWYDGTRYGYMNNKIDSLVPSIGFLNDMSKTVGSTAGVVGSLAGMNDTSIEDAAYKWRKDSIKVLPYAQTIGFGEYLKNITDSK